MSTKEQLIGLLFQIRGAASPLQKLKLAALAWRTLRGLDHHERLVVAKELGLSGAEHLVEKLSNQGGLSPTALLAAIHRAEEAEPEELRDLLDGVLDPERRDELLAGALRSAEAWVAEQEQAPGSEAESGAATGTDSGDDVTGVDSAPQTDAEPTPDPVSAPETVGVVGSPEASRPEAAPEKGPEAAAEAGSAPAARTGTAAGAGEGSTRQPDPKTPKPQDPTTSKPEASTHSDLLARLTSDISPFRRLRLLASEHGRTRQLSVAQLVEVLEVFPHGWVRRRALDSLLKRGVPEHLSDALDLVRRVADESSLMWAVAALAGRPGLSEEEKDVLEGAAEGKAALARRVAVRLERPRPKY